MYMHNLFHLKVSMALSKFHASAKEIVRLACEDALLREDFIPDPVEEPKNNGETICTIEEMS